MKKRIFLALSLVLFGVQSAFCACALTATARDEHKTVASYWELSWTPVTGATEYVIEGSPDNFETVRRIQIDPTDPLTLEVVRYTTVDETYQYRITAITPNETCSSTVNVTFKSDRDLVRLTRRSIIPLVGSTPGINGANFKTSLRLRNPNGEDMTGKLVFHPLGVPGSAADLSISYELHNRADVVEYADVVKEFGFTGLGSLDIVPDVHGTLASIPRAEVRLFNETPNGTFGAIEPQVQPFDFFVLAQPSETPVAEVTMPGPEMRLNIGARSLDSAFVIITATRNGQTLTNHNMEMPPNTLVFGPVAALLPDVELQPNDLISIRAFRGTAVPIYSLTDNATNDPALFVPASKLRDDVYHYSFEP
jgi:hypothetical protein